MPSSVIEEIREVFEGMGSPLVDLDDTSLLAHAQAALVAGTKLITGIGNVWKPERITTSSEMYRALAALAEIGECVAQEERN